MYLKMYPYLVLFFKTCVNAASSWVIYKRNNEQIVKIKTEQYKY